MSFDIRPLHRDLQTIGELDRVGLACFGKAYVAERRLLRRWESSDSRSIFLGAFDGERLTAYMGFLAYEAWAGKERCLAFQAVHGATDPEYKGQGLFTRLARQGMEMLPGDYLFGYPNEQAFPIWKDRLQFNVAQQVRIWLPHLGSAAFVGSLLMKQAVQDGRSYRVEERAAAGVKKRENPAAISEYEVNGNYLWGRIRARKLGPVTLKFFDVGGCDIRNPQRFGSLISAAATMGGAAAARFVCTDSTVVAKSARFTLPLEGKPVIWAPLRSDADCSRFDAYNGVADFW